MEDFIKFKDDNIFPEPITAEQALEVLQNFFLGEDFCIVDPVSPRQANVYVVDAILNKFPRKYKKFCKKNNWKFKE